MRKNELLKMNSFDFTFFALEDVVTAGGEIAIIRFKERHSAEEIRNAIRRMFSLYPRMRSIIESTFLSYRVRILNDNDKRTEALFNDTFRVVKNIHYGTPEFDEYIRYFYNEPFALEQGFPIKVRYLSDGDNPVLAIFVNHATIDGLAIIHMVNSIVAYLNGKNPPEVPITWTSYFPAYLEIPLNKFPAQLVRSLKMFISDMKKPKPGKTLQPSTRPVNFFGSVDNYNHYLSYGLDEIIEKTKGLGCSMTAFLMACLVVTLGKDKTNEDGDVIAIPMPMDIRRYYPGDDKPIFGNFVVAPMLFIKYEIWNSPLEILKEIKSQLERLKINLENRNNIVWLMLETIFTILGRKVYARAIRKFKEKGRLSKTATFSNVGNVDHLNKHGDKTQILSYETTGNSHGVLIVLVTMNKRACLCITYQEAEFSREEIKDLMKRYDETLDSFMRL